MKRETVHTWSGPDDRRGAPPRWEVRVVDGADMAYVHAPASEMTPPSLRELATALTEVADMIDAAPSTDTEGHVFMEAGSGALYVGDRCVDVSDSEERGQWYTVIGFVSREDVRVRNSDNVEIIVLRDDIRKLAPWGIESIDRMEGP